MANRLAKVLSSLTKASNERLDQVISALEDDEKPSLQKGIWLLCPSYYNNFYRAKRVECRFIKISF